MAKGRDTIWNITRGHIVNLNAKGGERSTSKVEGGGR